jgi:putative transposase
MELTNKQIEEILTKVLTKENGLNDILEMLLNAMMQSERSVHLKGCSNNKANGYRPGQVFGYGKQINLRIPRDRIGSFYPTILALFRDQETYLKEVSFQLYSKGLTTRDVSEVMETIYGNHYSKSTISSINKSFYEQMESWRNRQLEGHYQALYIDGLHVKLKRDGRYQNECFYIILGLKQDNTREIISIVNLPSESSQGWNDIFEDLKSRGLNSVGLIVSDGLSGLDSVISKHFKTAHQKCIVHLHRTLSSYVRRTDKKALAEDFKQVLSPNKEDYDLDQVSKALKSFSDKWRGKYPSLGKYIDKLEWQPYFTYLNYDVSIRRMIYTTNWIERFNRSARRTLKIRGAFPDEDSVLALITAVAMEKSDKQYKRAVYGFDNETKLKK